MARKINKTGLEKLKKWEGLRLDSYQDQAGVWTIGYGHTRGVDKGQRITKAQAEKLLREDLEWAEEAVNTLVKVDLTDNQFSALVSFVFNVGLRAFKSSTLLRELNKGNYGRVPAELAKWNKITVAGAKVVNRGLANRRAAEAGLWATGDFVSSRDVKPEPKESSTRQLVHSKEAQGVGITTVAIAGEQVTEAANQVSYVAEYSETLKILFAVLMVVGVALTLYAIIKRNKETD